MNKISPIILLLSFTIFIIIHYIIFCNNQNHITLKENIQSIKIIPSNNKFFNTLTEGKNCDNFSFTIKIEKNINDSFLRNLYKEILYLKKDIFYLYNNNCIDIFISNKYENTSNNNFIFIKNVEDNFDGSIQRINIKSGGRILGKGLFLNRSILKINQNERNKILKKLESRNLIKIYNNFCNILALTKNFEELVVLLIAIKCVPLINKSWIELLPLIDNDHSWDKAILSLRDINFYNLKYLLNVNISPSDIYEMEEYGKRLIVWNFITISSIAYNIIYYLEMLYTGINIERTVQAIPLYKEDEILFQKERLKKNILTDKYTVITLAYRRDREVNLSLIQYKNISYVDKVIIIWNDQNETNIRKKELWKKSDAPVFFIKTKKNSMNNRYLPYDIIKTECIFFLDDDIRITPKLLNKSFNLWRMNKDVIVGYYARLIQKGKNISYIIEKKQSYDLILLGLSLVHKRYIYNYSYKMSRKIREIVDETLNCDDIAFNFMVALYSNKPNLLFTKGIDLSRCKTCHHSGLFFRKDHISRRVECIRIFSNLYGINPMIENRYFVGVY